MEKTTTIHELWNEFVDKGAQPKSYKDYEMLEVNDVKVLVKDGKYVNINWLSRHKTSKHMLKISIEAKDNIDRYVIVTTDHVCMIYNRDHFFENVDAKALKVGDITSIWNDDAKEELVGKIVSIEDLGTTDEYVYDIEVDDKSHAFYANDILIHNSQFVNLQVVTDWLRAQNNWPELLQDWSADQKRALWDTMDKFVKEEVNPFVRNLVNKYCKSSETAPLVYELEYMGDVGVYESKKHYAIHKIFNEGDSVDKTKYTGIELKKGTVPKEMKTFLADIYAGVLQGKWKESDYEKYICELYDRFKDFSIDEISFWKGYSTERQATGFLQMEVGTTGIAKACTYYNQLIQKLGIGKKYEEIRVGDKVRFCYIDKNNDYGINQIAYKPGQWPKEFAKLFRPDYKTMFNKVILDPLKKFRIACQFNDIDPSRQVQFDIFTL